MSARSTRAALRSAFHESGWRLTLAEALQLEAMITHGRLDHAVRFHEGVLQALAEAVATMRDWFTIADEVPGTTSRGRSFFDLEVEDSELNPLALQTVSLPHGKSTTAANARRRVDADLFVIALNNIAKGHA